MKRIILFLVIAIASILFFAYRTYASRVVTHPQSITHPGRTDRYGCHHCWTNCAYWGLEYGEYHCH